MAKTEKPKIPTPPSMIDPSVNVRNLGTIFDNSICMDTHINQVWKTAFCYIHNIRRISKYLLQESLKTLVHAFVTSRFDYCNSLLYGLPKYHISELQRVQNAAARLITNTRKYNHITPALYNLHWLPVFYRSYFKILIFVTQHHSQNKSHAPLSDSELRPPVRKASDHSQTRPQALLFLYMCRALIILMIIVILVSFPFSSPEQHLPRQHDLETKITIIIKSKIPLK